MPARCSRRGGRADESNHRGPEFAALLERLSSGLQPFFQTRQDVLLMTCSGTGGMEGRDRQHAFAG